MGGALTASSAVTAAFAAFPFDASEEFDDDLVEEVAFEMVESFLAGTEDGAFETAGEDLLGVVAGALWNGRGPRSRKKMFFFVQNRLLDLPSSSPRRLP